MLILLGKKTKNSNVVVVSGKDLVFMLDSYADENDIYYHELQILFNKLKRELIGVGYLELEE